MWYDNGLDRDSPQCPYAPALAASFNFPGFLRVYGWTVYSSLTSAQWILYFDQLNAPGSGAVPICALPIAASNQVSAFWGDCGRIFRKGLWLCNSTTDTTLTPGAANCFFDVQADVLPLPS